MNPASLKGAVYVAAGLIVEVYPSVVISYSDAEGRREVGGASVATNEGPLEATGEAPEARIEE
jgi:hypothetical protein